MERFEEAENALIEAHKILGEALGVEHARAMESIEALVELYDVWGKPENPDEWRAKLPEMKPE